MKVGLALSGGGAKGAFQQGVLEGFEKHGLFSSIDLVSGVSIGALHALCMASDKLGYSRTVWETVDKKQRLDRASRRGRVLRNPLGGGLLLG